MPIQPIEGDPDVGWGNAPMFPVGQVVRHVNETHPTVSVSATRNTKGWNIEASVKDAEDVEEAMRLLIKATNALEAQYGRGDG